MQARSWATVEAEDSSRSPSRGERGRGRATAFLPNARNGWSIVWEPGYSKEATRGQRELLISNAFFFLFFLSELFERKTHSAHVPGTWIFKGGNEWATSTFDFECVFLPEVREFITRHTAYNKHDTGWARGFEKENPTAPAERCPAQALPASVCSRCSVTTAWEGGQNIRMRMKPMPPTPGKRV